MKNEVLFDAIGAQEWLDDASDPVQKFVRQLPQELKDILHGVWLGHPLHPVLTDIPVGAWTCAMVLDALESISGRKELGAGADAAVGLGLLGAVGSAITGLTDWSETNGRGKRIGAVHAALNIVATVLYTSSFVMRKKRATRSTGIALSMLGYAIASGSAYLGGHLVFGEQIGVDHTATSDNATPAEFTRTVPSGDLAADRPTRVVVDGVAVCMIPRGNAVHAITDTCPHLGGPLSEGKLEGDVITCPWHGSRFDVTDGEVVNGPSTYPARPFEVRERDGWIEVRAARQPG